MRRLRSFRRSVALALFPAAFALVGCEPQTTNEATEDETPVVEVVEPSDSTEPSETTATVSPAEVALKTADRAEFDETLAGLKGKVVLVDYWATWCTPCVEQFPHTVAKANELADREFAAVSVSLDDPGDPEPILEFLRGENAGLVQNLVSAHGAAPESYEAFELKGGPPWYQLYDRKGELKYVFCDAPEAGVEALPVDQIDAKIEEMLAQPQE